MALPKVAGGSGSESCRALMPVFRRTTASTRATWKGTLSPLPASAPAMASGGCSRPGQSESECQGPSTLLAFQRSELRLRIEGPDLGTPFCTGCLGSIYNDRFPTCKAPTGPWTLRRHVPGPSGGLLSSQASVPHWAACRGRGTDSSPCSPLPTGASFRQARLCT